MWYLKYFETEEQYKQAVKDGDFHLPYVAYNAEDGSVSAGEEMPVAYDENAITAKFVVEKVSPSITIASGIEGVSESEQVATCEYYLKTGNHYVWVDFTNNIVVAFLTPTPTTADTMYIVHPETQEIMTIAEYLETVSAPEGAYIRLSSADTPVLQPTSLGGVTNKDDDTYGLSYAFDKILVDDVEIDMENDITYDEDYSLGNDVGALYQFTSEGEHTVTYYLKETYMNPTEEEAELILSWVYNIDVDLACPNMVEAYIGANIKCLPAALFVNSTIQKLSGGENNINCYFLFAATLSTSLDLSDFNTSNVTNMNCMFVEALALTSITFGENWDTSKVTDMSYMFSVCSGLTSLDLTNFDTSNVTDMSYMFSECGSSEQTLNITYDSRIGSNLTTLPTDNPSYISFTDINPNQVIA